MPFKMNIDSDYSFLPSIVIGEEGVSISLEWGHSWANGRTDCVMMKITSELCFKTSSMGQIVRFISYTKALSTEEQY